MALHFLWAIRILHTMLVIPSFFIGFTLSYLFTCNNPPHHPLITTWSRHQPFLAQDLSILMTTFQKHSQESCSEFLFQLVGTGQVKLRLISLVLTVNHSLPSFIILPFGFTSSWTGLFFFFPLKWIWWFSKNLNICQWALSQLGVNIMNPFETILRIPQSKASLVGMLLLSCLSVGSTKNLKLRIQDGMANLGSMRKSWEMFSLIFYFVFLTLCWKFQVLLKLTRRQINQSCFTSWFLVFITFETKLMISLEPLKMRTSMLWARGFIFCLVKEGYETSTQSPVDDVIASSPAPKDLRCDRFPTKNYFSGCSPPRTGAPTRKCLFLPRIWSLLLLSMTESWTAIITGFRFLFKYGQNSIYISSTKPLGPVVVVPTQEEARSKAYDLTRLMQKKKWV